MQASLSYTVVGDTVNTASRLSDAASIGAVYAGRATALATMSIASWRALPPLRLKGKREPVAGLRAGRASPAGRRAARARRGGAVHRPGRGVRPAGRPRARRRRARQARRRSSSPARPGSARPGSRWSSREFAGELPARTGAVGALPAVRREPRAVGARRVDAHGLRHHRGRRRRRRRSAGCAGRWRGSRRRRRPADQLRRPSTGCSRCSAWSSGRRSGRATPRRRVRPSCSRDPTVEAVVAVLAALVAEGPLVLVVDDAQWATGDLLGVRSRHLANEVLGAVLFVTVGRSGPAHRDVVGPDARRRGAAGRAARRGGERAAAAGLPRRRRARPRTLASCCSAGRRATRSSSPSCCTCWSTAACCAATATAGGSTGELPARGAAGRCAGGARRAHRRADARPRERCCATHRCIGNRFTAEMLRSLEPTADDGDDPVERRARRARVARASCSRPATVSEAAPHFVLHPRARPRRRLRRHPEGRAGPPSRDGRAMGDRRTALVGRPRPTRSSRRRPSRRSRSPTEMGLPSDDPAWSAREIGFGALDRLGEAALARDDNDRAESLLTPRRSTLADGELPSRRPRPGPGPPRGRAGVAAPPRRRRGRSRGPRRPRATCGPASAALVVQGEILRRRRRRAACHRGAGVRAGCGERVRPRPGHRRGAAPARADRLPRRAARIRRGALRAGARAWPSGSATAAARAGRCSTWPGTPRPAATTREAERAARRRRPTSSPASTTTAGCRGAPAPRRSSGCCRAGSSRRATSRRACCRSAGRWATAGATAACLTIDAFAAAELGQITTALEESAGGVRRVRGARRHLGSVHGVDRLRHRAARRRPAAQGDPPARARRRARGEGAPAAAGAHSRSATHRLLPARPRRRDGGGGGRPSGALEAIDGARPAAAARWSGCGCCSRRRCARAGETEEARRAAPRGAGRRRRLAGLPAPAGARASRRRAARARRAGTRRWRSRTRRWHSRRRTCGRGS